ncbi:MAG: hypothetical protein IJV00_06265, partial [Clostridia bacterium]|nr:hypothetical protein [Clostridia bacterium]
MEKYSIKSKLLEQLKDKYQSEALCDRTPFIRQRIKKIKKDLDSVYSRNFSKEIEDEDLLWFCDNYYYISDVLSGLDRSRSGYYDVVLSACEMLIELSGKSLDAESIRALFEALKDSGSQDRMFRSVRDTLLFSLCSFINCSLSDGTGGLGKLITSLRFAAGFDFQTLIDDFSSLERLLRSDPANVYQISDKPSQALLRNRVIRLAAKKNISEEAFLKDVLEQANKENRSVFDLLGRPYKGKIYYALRFSLFFLLVGGFAAFCSRGGIGWVWLFSQVLLLPCAWCLSGELSVFAASRFSSTQPLLRIKTDRCPDDAVTCVALTCMVKDSAEACELCEKLENLFLSQFPSKKRDPNVFFGVIGDLAPASVKEKPEDEEVKNQLLLSVESLNLKYGGGFFCYLRPRVFCECENSFIGWERKRGAIGDFADDCALASRKDRFIGETSFIGKAKLLVTLDRDTVMGFKQLYRLIGASLHPQNRPVVGTVKGVPVVVRGHGVLQPRIVDRIGKKSTPFGILLCGAGGNESYSTASFDVFQDLFGCAVFCGKGMIDLEAYRSVCSGAFEESRILSHDIPEGARLRCGLLSDQCFSESVPESTQSYESRKHRWIRGDVQSLGCAFKKVRNACGDLVYNPVESVYRFVLFDNVVNDLACAFVFLLLCLGALLPGALAWRTALFATLYLFAPFFFHCLGAIFSGKLKSLSFSFYSKVLSGVWMSFLTFIKNLASLAEDSKNSFDAAFRSIWRLTFSKKRLLEWKTFNSSSGSNSLRSHVITNAFSLAAGLILLIFSPNRPSRLFGLLWTLYPFASYLISKPYKSKRGISGKNKKILLEYLRDSFKFFEEHSGPSNAYLVPDNVSVSPLDNETRLLSPTNAGLYLLCLVAARDLGFISTAQAVMKISSALSTIEKLEKFNGNLYNWYDLKDMSPVGRRYVSTVDSGNFCVSLVCLVNAMKSFRSEDSRTEALISKCTSLIDAMRFDFLFDRTKDLFSIGYDVESGARDPNHYDLYMSEARMTSFYCVGRGLVPSGHWNDLGRILVKNKN